MGINEIFVLVLLFVGVAAGAMVAWLILRSKAQQAYSSAKTESAVQTTSLQERLAARDDQLQKLHEAFAKTASDLEAVKENNSRLQAELQGERRASTERLESFKQAADELAEKFKALSRDALKDNSQSFVDLARAELGKYQEKAKGDLELRTRAID